MQLALEQVTQAIYNKYHNPPSVLRPQRTISLFDLISDNSHDSPHKFHVYCLCFEQRLREIARKKTQQTSRRLLSRMHFAFPCSTMQHSFSVGFFIEVHFPISSWRKRKKFYSQEIRFWVSSIFSMRPREGNARCTLACKQLNPTEFTCRMVNCIKNCVASYLRPPLCSHTRNFEIPTPLHCAVSLLSIVPRFASAWNATSSMERHTNAKEFSKPKCYTPHRSEYPNDNNNDNTEQTNVPLRRTRVGQLWNKPKHTKWRRERRKRNCAQKKGKELAKEKSRNGTPTHELCQRHACHPSLCGAIAARFHLPYAISRMVVASVCDSIWHYLPENVLNSSTPLTAHTDIHIPVFLPYRVQCSMFVHLYNEIEAIRFGAFHPCRCHYGSVVGRGSLSFFAFPSVYLCCAHRLFLPGSRRLPPPPPLHWQMPGAYFS